MARAIGFRAEPDAVNWAIVDGSNDTPLLFAQGKLTAPVSYTEAQSLSWYHDHVGHLLEQYTPQTAGVRYPEVIGRAGKLDSARKRCRIEGIILERVNRSGLVVNTGALVTISKHLGTKSAKAYLQADEIRGLDWKKYAANLREAILVAVASL